MTIRAFFGTTTVLDLSYEYPTPNNANIASVSNLGDRDRTQSYTYDQLNRIDTAQSQANPPNPDCWGQNCDYDEPQWGHVGNLNKITVTKCSADALNLSINWKNRITNSGFTYDDAGNMTTDGVRSYTWNSENLLKSVAGTNYTYDGDGWRVKKTGGTLQWRSIFGYLLAESDLTGNITREYIYFAGKRIARRDANANVYYFFQDHLESTRVITNASGGIVRESDYYPFGGERVIGTPTLDDPHKFAGMYQDSESGLYHTWFRMYSPSLARWLSADPVAGSVANPQSLNRYNYVLNNPTNLVDPFGLWAICFASYACRPHGYGQVCYLIWVSCLEFPDGPTVNPSLPGGAGGGNQGLLDAAQQRVAEDLAKPDCAALFKDPGAVTKKLAKVGFKDLGPLKFTTASSGEIVRESGALGQYSSFLFWSSINLNSQVNWADPNNTAAFLDGNALTYPALQAGAYALGVPSMTAEQFMDLTILHELTHYKGKFDPHEKGGEKKLWDDCIN